MFKDIRFIHGNRGALILTLALVVFAFGRSRLEAQSSTVTGIVRGRGGQPISGAVVRLKSEDGRLAFLVVSQANGRYTTPNLLPGKYRVEAFGGDFHSLAGAVEVRSGKQAKRDLAWNAPLKATTPPQEVTFQQRLTNADYAKAMPGGDGKKLILTRCVLCHGLERTVPRRATRQEWEETLDAMRENLRDHRVPMSDQEKSTMLDYVATNFGKNATSFAYHKGPAPHPDSNLPRSLLTGTEAKFVAMEFYLQRPAWTHHLAVDSQGVAWFSETNVGTLGRFDPRSFSYTHVNLPPGKSANRFINAVRVDPQDRVWVTDNDPNGLLFEYDPKSKEFHTFDIPVPPGLKRNLNTLRFDADGNVWGTAISADQILRLDPNTGRWVQYHVVMGSHPYGMAIGGDQMIWYTAHFDNDIVRLDPFTGKQTHYKVPTPGSDVRVMQADADGNLWAAAHGSGKLVKMDYGSGKLTEYEPPTKRSGPFSLDVDTRRNLIWFGEMYAGKMGRFDPKSNTFVEFPLPEMSVGEWDAEFSDANVLWIQVDPSNPNRVWWGGGGIVARIGYVEVME